MVGESNFLLKNTQEKKIKTEYFLPKTLKNINIIHQKNPSVALGFRYWLLNNNI